MKPRIKKIAGFFHDLRRSTDGSSAVELAFLIPLIATLAVGGFDFGRALMHNTKVESAARTGVQYALHDRDFDSADETALKATIATKAREDFGDNALSVATTFYCHCPSTGAAQQPCNANCSGTGQNPANRYVIVQTNYILDFTFDYPGLPASLSLTGEVEMRIR